MQNNERPQRWEECIVCAPQNSKEYGVQVNTLEFDGDTEPKAFLDWVDSIESYFDWKDVQLKGK